MSKRIHLPLGSEKKLIALTAGQISLEGEGENKQLPTRLLVFPWGTHDTNKGRLIVNETTAGVLAHNQDAAKYDRVAFDFQHNTVKATPGDEPIKVAGYGTPEVVPGEGIYLSNIEYNAKGKEILSEGHYPDISPSVKVNKDGEVIFLHSVGAVRQGEVDGLVLFDPDEKGVAAFAALESAGLIELEGTPELDPSNIDWRSVAIEALNANGANLTEDAESTDVIEVVNRLRTAPKQSPSSKPDSKSPETKSMSADTVLNEDIEKRLVALEASATETKRQAILDQAKRDGKIIPLSADKINELSPEILEDMVDKLPEGQVALESEIEGADDTIVDLSAGGADSQLQKSINNQLGLSDDDFKKYAS